MSKLVEFRTAVDPPDGLIDILKHALRCAEDGTLRECILSFAFDDDDAPLYEDGTKLLSELSGMWRADGRLDAIHSKLRMMEHVALMELIEEWSI
jgi:hypothetical protein